jgi:valyl-tRNA synthetase
VPASAEAEVMIVCQDEEEMKCLAEGADYIERLAKANPLDVSMDCSPPSMAACEAVSSVNIYVPLAKLIDVQKSKEKLTQRKQSIEKEVAKVNSQLANPDFKSKAPADKVAKIEAQLADLTRQLESVEAQLTVLENS